jgi:hypothetical protein
MVAAINRRRPKKIAASLPDTVANVARIPSAVRMRAGDRTVPPAPVLAATNTPAPQGVEFEGVNAVADRIGHRRPVAKHGAEIEHRDPAWRDGVVFRASRHDQNDKQPGNRRAAGRRNERTAPAQKARKQVRAGKRQRARDAHARRVARGRPRHELGIDLIGQEFQAGHIGAGPADPGQRTRAERRPESFGEQSEQQVADDGQADTEQIDLAWIEAVGGRDEDRHRDHVSAEKNRGDPAGLAPAQAPQLDHARQQRRPERCADLDEHLRKADNGDEALRRHQAAAGRGHSRGAYAARDTCGESTAAFGFFIFPESWNYARV